MNREGLEGGVLLRLLEQGLEELIEDPHDTG